MTIRFLILPVATLNMISVFHSGESIHGSPTVDKVVLKRRPSPQVPNTLAVTLISWPVS